VEKDEQVKFEFFKWFEGYWVNGGKAFGVGDRLSFEDRAKVPDLDDPGSVDNAEVAFSTEFTVGDVDFNRSYRIPKKAGRGIRIQQPAPVCSVVLVDSAGRLAERILALDSSHPGKKALGDRVWEPPRAKKREPPRDPRRGPGIGPPRKGHGPPKPPKGGP
jgi:hypothetical protein